MNNFHNDVCPILLQFVITMHTSHNALCSGLESLWQPSTISTMLCVLVWNLYDNQAQFPQLLCVLVWNLYDNQAQFPQCFVFLSGVSMTIKHNSRNALCYSLASLWQPSTIPTMLCVLVWNLYDNQAQFTQCFVFWSGISMTIKHNSHNALCSSLASLRQPSSIPTMLCVLVWNLYDNQAQFPQCFVF